MSQINAEVIKTIMEDYKTALLDKSPQQFLRHLAPGGTVYILPVHIDDPEHERAKSTSSDAYGPFLRAAVARTDYLAVELSDAKASYRDKKQQARVTFTSREAAIDKSIRLIAHQDITLYLKVRGGKPQITEAIFNITSVKPSQTVGGTATGIGVQE